MKLAWLLEVSLPLWSMILISISANEVSREPLFSAMFVFGDSLLDNGNNNKLHTLAKANFMPYGIDFLGDRPTGRFCNGKTPIDFLGELLGLPYLPAFADTIAQSGNISKGVNYASASSGIMDETGRHLGENISFSQQVRDFETTLGQMKTLMEEEKLSQYLANSFTLVGHGSNDYINNYLLPEFYGTSLMYSPKDYVDILIELYKKQILTLHSLGLRRFLLAAVGPLGCIPNQLSKVFFPIGQCRHFVNDMVVMFNALLRSLVDQLNAEYQDSIFVYGDTYKVFGDMIEDPRSYGFTVTNTACCGMGRYKGQINCLPMFIPCPNRDEYMFWDAFHPSQAVNKIAANKAFTGPPSVCYPINVLQMAQKQLPPCGSNTSTKSIRSK